MTGRSYAKCGDARSTAPDRALWNDWHAVAKVEDIPNDSITRARLLERDVEITRLHDGRLRAGIDGETGSTPCPAEERYGLAWVCPGDPAHDILSFPEYDDPCYQVVLCGPFGLAASGPRIVENFLDMAHFPFVHAGILGQEPDTEVPDYDVATIKSGEELVARNCAFVQPRTRVLAHDGSIVRYSYRVLRPFSAVLAKLPDAATGNSVSILLTVQPVEPERSKAWILFAVTDLAGDPRAIRAHQDRIFFQDKPILENQRPKRLPLGAGEETHLRCDRLSSHYRRYLRRKDVGFGVLAAIRK